MPREIVKVPKGSHGGGIIYLAVLAYPENKDKRDKFVESAWAGIAKGAYMRGEIQRSKVPVQYRRMKNATLASTVRAGLTRVLEQRMYSYYYALAYIRRRWESDPKWRQSAQDGVPGDDSSLRYVLRPRSRTHAARRFYDLVDSDDDDIDDPDSQDWVRPTDDDLNGTTDSRARENSKRHWKSSKPVLHLILALPFGDPLKLINIGNEEPFHLPIGVKNGRPLHALVGDGKWVDETLPLAEVWRKLILPKFFKDYDESETIQLVLA